MAVAVIGGLAASTALSLLVVPSLYVLAARALAAVRRRLRRRGAQADPPLPPPG